MSREALLAFLLIGSCLIQSQMPHVLLRTSIAVIAAGFVVAQGFILYASRAVLAWNLGVLPAYMTTASFYAGCGMNLLNHLDFQSFMMVPSLLAGVAGIGDWFFWRIYMDAVRNVTSGGMDLRSSPKQPFLSRWISRPIIPMVLLGLGLGMGFMMGAGIISTLLTGAAAVGMLIGSSLQKYRILSEMAILRGVWLRRRT
jgi:hypothetical protein